MDTLILHKKKNKVLEDTKQEMCFVHGIKGHEPGPQNNSNQLKCFNQLCAF